MNEISTTTEQAREVTTSAALVLNSASMESMMRMAETMASGSATVPKHLQGKPADCLAVVMQAMQWQMNPFAVGQKTHIVNGTLGYEAQLVNAVVQSSNSIVGSFKYEYEGKSPALNCRVGAVLRGDSAITWGTWLCENAVTTKNSPLWKVNPAQQLGYLQVKNWARLYCPGAILGVYTPDELSTPITKDMGMAEVVQQAPVFYDQLQFDTNFTAWKKAIEQGKKTPDALIATVESKAPLTEAQKAAIRSIQRPADASQASSAKPSQSTGEITYAQVLDKLQAAKDADALDIAADWIKSVSGDEMQTELIEKYEALRANFA